MKSRQLVLIAAILSSIALPPMAMANVRDERPNLIGGELGGRGVLFTLNYERFFSNDFGLGAGLMAIKTSGGGATIVPLYASFVPGNTHSPYLSAGATLISGGGDVNDWESTWLVTVSAGYQYQSSGGFFVRPFFSYVRAMEHLESDDPYIVWPGLTIGGSF